MQNKKSLTEQMREICEKNLPEQLGDVLKKRLTDLELLEKRNAETTQAFEELITKHDKTVKQLTEVQNRLSLISCKEHDLNKKEKELNEKETNLNLKEKEMNLTIQFTNEKITLLKEMYKIPFSNRIVRESCLLPIKVKETYVQQGAYNSNTGQNNEHITETEKIENCSKETNITEA